MGIYFPGPSDGATAVVMKDVCHVGSNIPADHAPSSIQNLYPSSHQRISAWLVPLSWCWALSQSRSQSQPSLGFKPLEKVCDSGSTPR